MAAVLACGGGPDMRAAVIGHHCAGANDLEHGA
jgi:hypothetical protein